MDIEKMLRQMAQLQALFPPDDALTRLIADEESELSADDLDCIAAASHIPYLSEAQQKKTE